MGPAEHPRLSALESTWQDNIARERKFLRDNPNWTIKRIKADSRPAEPVTFEASDGTMTLRSADLGQLLNLAEQAIREDEQ